ncbi:MAG: hypothetical protein KGZ63_12510 [Clostridiales bacterium]|nr:hypothetical protein [Clostridiales bacterium]
MAEKNKPYTVKITETAWEMLISHARFLANVSVPAANHQNSPSLFPRLH